jgi:hypothetical protein
MIHPKAGWPSPAADALVGIETGPGDPRGSGEPPHFKACPFEMT